MKKIAILTTGVFAAFALAACEPADPVAEEQAELVEQEADVTAAQLEEQADAAYDQGMDQQGDALDEEADAVEDQADAQADQIRENSEGMKAFRSFGFQKGAPRLGGGLSSFVAVAPLDPAARSF